MDNCQIPRSAYKNRRTRLKSVVHTRSCEAGSPFGHYLKWKRCEIEQEKVAANHKRKTCIHFYDPTQEAAKSHSDWMKLNGQSSYLHGVFLRLYNAFL
jgi:hypothetical protein